MKATILLALAGLWLSTAQAAGPETLTLACQGTAKVGDAKPEPVSMGIIIDFTDRTVIGFTPGSNVRVAITALDDVNIVFEGSSENRWVAGAIDRITGDATANTTLGSLKTAAVLVATEYSLKCKPKQRMF